MVRDADITDARLLATQRDEGLKLITSQGFEHRAETAYGQAYDREKLLGAQGDRSPLGNSPKLHKMVRHSPSCAI